MKGRDRKLAKRNLKGSKKAAPAAADGAYGAIKTKLIKFTKAIKKPVINGYLNQLPFKLYSLTTNYFFYMILHSEPHILNQ